MLGNLVVLFLNLIDDGVKRNNLILNSDILQGVNELWISIAVFLAELTVEYILVIIAKTRVLPRFDFLTISLEVVLDLVE